MVASPQSQLVYALARIGLDKTLIATERAEGLAVHRLQYIDHRLSLQPLGQLQPQRFAAIGRVGAPDPVLRLPWSHALTFYGRWYDELAPADRGYRLRRKIAQAPRETQVAQLQRDDKFGLVGTCYAVFQAILEAKQRVPLVLLNSNFLDQASLPVVLPREQEDRLYRDLESVLRLMLKPAIEREQAAAPGGVERTL